MRAERTWQTARKCRKNARGINAATVLEKCSAAKPARNSERIAKVL